ncbi:MAG TPA: hypothetical protein VKY56_03100 [Chloroflexota bacterium]|jgi:uncharacterized protein involved in exopolysaccharide biosynthesis|nr:hypothetical protein [Chloroflexota bacterium]
MATDIARDLEDQLVEAKAALQDHAEEMLQLLARFEAQIQARLDAAEARISALRAALAQSAGAGSADSPDPTDRPRAD